MIYHSIASSPLHRSASILRIQIEFAGYISDFGCLSLEAYLTRCTNHATFLPPVPLMTTAQDIIKEPVILLSPTAERSSLLVPCKNSHSLWDTKGYVLYAALFIRSCSIVYVWIDKRVRSSKLGSVFMTGVLWLSASEGFNLHRVRKANLASCIFAVET